MSRTTSFAIAFAVVLADQLSKLLVVARVGEFDTVVLVPGMLNIVRSTNRGIAFGILSDSSAQWTTGLLIALAAAVLAFLGWLIWRGHNDPAARLLTLAMALIMGGAAGNLVDRLLHGEVIDFIDFYIRRYHWYTFNVADAAITIGAALAIYDNFASPGRIQQD